MFASLKTHAQILGRRALSARPHGLAVCGVGVLLTALLSACGQKGPLFLPPGTVAPQAAPAVQATPANAAATLPQAGSVPVVRPSLPASAP